MAGTRCGHDHLRAGVHGRHPRAQRVPRLDARWWSGQPDGRVVRAAATDRRPKVEGAGDLQRHARATACRATRDRATHGRDSTAGGWSLADRAVAAAVGAVSTPSAGTRAARSGPRPQMTRITDGLVP